MGPGAAWVSVSGGTVGVGYTRVYTKVFTEGTSEKHEGVSLTPSPLRPRPQSEVNNIEEASSVKQSQPSKATYV